MIVLTSVASVAVLFLLTKLMGNKQISQLSMFDYVVGISIGSIAAEMAIELEAPLYPLTALVIYALMAFFISLLTNKSLRIRRVFTGRPLVLMDGGELYREQFKKARLDIGDFLTLCRVNGYFNINEIETAIMEENGTVSFLPKSGSRPATPEDLKLYPAQSKAVYPLIQDGVVMERGLSAIEKDEKWLRDQIVRNGFSDPREVFYAFANEKKEVTAYAVTPKKPPRTSI